MCGKRYAMLWRGLALSFSLLVLSPLSLYSDEMIQIRESELRELESINERQRTRLAELESLLTAQRITLATQRSQIGMLRAELERLSESSETLSATMLDLRTSFDEYESAVQSERRRDRWLFAAGGAATGYLVIRTIEALATNILF